MHTPGPTTAQAAISRGVDLAVNECRRTRAADEVHDDGDHDQNDDYSSHGFPHGPGRRGSAVRVDSGTKLQTKSPARIARRGPASVKLIRAALAGFADHALKLRALV